MESAVNSQEIADGFETACKLSKKSKSIRIQFEKISQDIKKLNGVLQDILTIHAKFPEVFQRSTDVKESVNEFMRSSNFLIERMQNLDFSNLDTILSTIQKAKSDYSKITKPHESLNYVKSIHEKLISAENDIKESFNIKLQINNYIDYQNRNLEFVMAGKSRS